MKEIEDCHQVAENSTIKERDEIQLHYNLVVVFKKLASYKKILTLTMLFHSLQETL